jgi:hypothetical protein
VDWKASHDRLTRRRARAAERAFGKEQREAFLRLLAGNASPQDGPLAMEALQIARKENGPSAVQVDPAANEPMTAREATEEILGRWPTDEEWAQWENVVGPMWAAVQGVRPHPQPRRV